jgi:hypothetical protein
MGVRRKLGRGLILSGAAVVLLSLAAWIFLGAAPALALQVRVVPSTMRLTPSTKVSAYPQRVQLQAARGESEGAQLVISVERGQQVKVLTSRLVNRAGRALASTATTYLEKPIVVRSASPNGKRGTYYDPLLDVRSRWMTLKTNTRATLWLDIAVSRAAKPGTYTGAVTIQRRSGKPVRVPVKLVVDSATLPARPTLLSSVGVDASQLARFEGVHQGRGLNGKLDQYFSLLASMRLSTADPNVVVPVGQSISAIAAAEPGQALAATFDRSGVASFRIPFYETYPYGDPLGSDRAKAINYLRATATYYRAKGWLSRSYVYTVDEPGTGDADRVQAFHRLVKEADPALQLLVTSEPRNAFEGNVDIWVSNLSARVKRADISRVRKQRKQYWWYPSISTFDPYPTLYIDDLRASPRAMGWLAWRYHVQGFFYWSATHWHEVKNPWTQPGTFRSPDGDTGNGDGSLIYPGKPQGLDRPMPSIRLLQLRDGIEDFDLLTLAQRAGKGSVVGLRVAQSAPSLTDWSASATDARKIRAAAFAAIPG